MVQFYHATFVGKRLTSGRRGESIALDTLNPTIGKIRVIKCKGVWVKAAAFLRRTRHLQRFPALFYTILLSMFSLF